MALNRTDEWDVLIAHYLGVDHAGHTFGVQTQEMYDKLDQIDQQVCDTIEALMKRAGPGGSTKPVFQTDGNFLGFKGRWLLYQTKTVTIGLTRNTR